MNSRFSGSPRPTSRYPRAQALRALTRVLSSGDPLEAALAEGWEGATPEARAWLQDVCSGTLRWKGRLDLAIDSLAEKRKPTGALRKLLLIGAYQLIVQERTDPVSVVVETVDAVKAKEGEAPAKFANAILRRLSERAKEWRELPFPKKAPVADKAAWASLPLWIWNRFAKAWGEERASQLAQALLERPSIWLQSDGIAADEALGLKEGPWAGSLQWVPGSCALTELPGWSEGKLFVQDLSSQRLAREALAELPPAAREGLALDLCAAPGGKGIALAWGGMKVVATDRPGERFRLLQENVARLGRERVSVVDRDKIPDEPWSLIWVDAPCTGSGILRRHPEARWLRRESDLESLITLQNELIREAWERLPTGGHLLYSVCSLLEDEGRLHFAEGKLLGGAKFETVKEWTLWPQEAPSGDGFWGILVKKT